MAKAADSTAALVLKTTRKDGIQMTKFQMVNALRAIGAHVLASALDAYRDKNGRNYGWNAWLNARI